MKLYLEGTTCSEQTYLVHQSPQTHCSHTCPATPSQTSLLLLTSSCSTTVSLLGPYGFSRSTETQCNSFWPFPHFSFSTFKANITSVVQMLYCSKKQYCCPLILSLINLVSTTSSHIFILCLINSSTPLFFLFFAHASSHAPRLC